MFVTSTGEMLAPGVASVIFMLLNEVERCIDLLPRKAGVLCEFNRGLDPKFGFAIGTLSMHMHSRLCPREEIKPETTLTKNGWTHGQ